MNATRKRVFLLLTVFLLCLALSGCHGSRGLSAFAVPESFDTNRSFEISFWAKNDTNKTQTAIYEKAIRDFEALYPNIRVKLRLYTDYGKIYNDVITNIATNTTPNVCISYPDHIATYLTGSNVVVPLEALFADPRYGLGGSEVRFDAPTEEEIIPQFLSECSFSGHTYAVPYMRSTEACYINKDLVEKLGYELPETLTWDFVWEVSDAARGLLQPRGGDRPLQRYDEGAAPYRGRARQDRRLLHLQDLQLSGQLPQRGPVRLRGGLHRRRHLDRLLRPALGHQPGQVRGV